MSSHHHHHHHNHISENLTTVNSVYYIAIFLNLAYVVIEAIMGYRHDSASLLSDAGHKLFDSTSLIVALVGFKLANLKAGKPGFNHKKTSAVIALVNSILLIFILAHILLENFGGMHSHEHMDGLAVSWTAAIGIVVSGVSALLLMKHKEGDINTKAAFLHMAADSLVSIGVVLSGLVMHLTHWYVLDSIVSLLIVAFILVNTIKLLCEAVKMIRAN